MAGQLQTVTNLSGLCYPSQRTQCTKERKGDGKQVASERKKDEKELGQWGRGRQLLRRAGLPTLPSLPECLKWPPCNTPHGFSTPKGGTGFVGTTERHEESRRAAIHRIPWLSTQGDLSYHLVLACIYFSKPLVFLMKKQRPWEAGLPRGQAANYGRARIQIGRLPARVLLLGWPVFSEQGKL